MKFFGKCLFINRVVNVKGFNVGLVVEFVLIIDVLLWVMMYNVLFDLRKDKGVLCEVFIL